MLPGCKGNACRGCGLSRGSLPVRNTGETESGLVSSDTVLWGIPGGGRVKNKHQVSRLLLCNTNRQAWCGRNVIHSPSMGQFTYENSFWHQNPLEVHAHGEDTCVFKHLGLLTYFYVKLGPRRRVVGTHSVGKGLQWNLVWKSPVDCKTDLL